jgi:glycosyltransferase involved in cell wall biosynthesis
MPTIALEALSLGLPVYGSDIPAFRELGLKYIGIEKQIETGEYYPPNVPTQSVTDLVKFVTYL